MNTSPLNLQINQTTTLETNITHKQPEQIEDMIANTNPLPKPVINVKTPYRIISWNINGYTNDIHEWLLTFARSERPDVIFLSETKKNAVDLSQLFRAFTEYNFIINAHNPAKWHGVAMLIRNDHSYEQLSIEMNIGVRKDSNGNEAATGRLIAIVFNKQFYIIGSYTPNSGQSDPIKLDYRTKTWDPTFFRILEKLRNSGPTIWIGDINVAPDEIDISNPKTMRKYAGFTKEERDNFRSLLETGNWIDIWRYQHPTERVYTWCGCPPRPNYGMRLDNAVVSKSLLPQMQNSFVISECPISADHIPIGVIITPTI
jgi:exodeoxyribonuclease III